ncbi:acyl carrier protein, partial [Gracilibacillus sp. JCM 18860]|uniref:acyl carrier protein n=1 Tax=Gracilibacillus sp. JCM 18860 TaxID=1306159 RepID=UPI0032613FC4
MAIDAKEIHHDVPLSENGFDPLKLTQLADRLNNKFGLELTTLDFAEKSTLYDLVQFVQSTKPSKENSRLWEKTIDYLKENLSLLFKVNAEEIAHDMDLEKYGINSIMVLKLNQQ